MSASAITTDQSKSKSQSQEGNDEKAVEPSLKPTLSLSRLGFRGGRKVLPNTTTKGKSSTKSAPISKKNNRTISSQKKSSYRSCSSTTTSSTSSTSSTTRDRNSSSTQPSSSQNSKKKRKKDSSWEKKLLKLLPPIPSFGGSDPSNSQYDDLKRLEKEFLGEDVSSDDNDNENDDNDNDINRDRKVPRSSAVATHSSTKKLPSFSKPPIPNFHHWNSGSDDDDNDTDDEEIKLLSSTPTILSSSNRCKKQPSNNEPSSKMATTTTTTTNLSKKRPTKPLKRKESSSKVIGTTTTKKSSSCPAILETVVEAQEEEEADDDNDCNFDPADRTAMSQQEIAVSSCPAILETVVEAQEEEADDDNDCNFDPADRTAMSQQEIPASSCPAILETLVEAQEEGKGEADDDNDCNFDPADPPATSQQKSGDKGNVQSTSIITIEKNSSVTGLVTNLAATSISSQRKTKTYDDLGLETSKKDRLVDPSHNVDNAKDKNTNPTLNSTHDEARTGSSDTPSNGENETIHKKNHKANTSNEFASMLATSINTLFAKTDTVAVTTKMFYKAVEENLAVKLDKRMKRTVRERLTELVNGRTKPNLPPIGHTTAPSSHNETACPIKNDSIIPTADDATNITPSTEICSKMSSTIDLSPGGVPQGKDDIEPECVPVAPPDNQNVPPIQETIDDGKSVGVAEVKSLKRIRTTNGAHDSTGREQEHLDQSDNNSAAVTPVDDKAEQPKHLEPKATIGDERISDGSNGAASNDPANLSVFDEVKVTKRTTKKQKRSKPGKENKHTGDKVDTDATECLVVAPIIDPLGKDEKNTADRGRGCEDDDKDVCEIWDPEKKPATTVAAEKAPVRRKRGRPAKGGEVSTDKPSAKASAETTLLKVEPSSAPPPVRNRKRARKGTCALCSTCPCQISQGDTTASILDLKSMSRSDVAVEKALIRRVQKLEKSTEHMEDQMEIVKRKLKKHRRDMWKKREKEKEIPGGTSCQASRNESRFLPDAEEFEGDFAGALGKQQVDQAQRRMFPSVANYQSTLKHFFVGRDGEKKLPKEEQEDLEGPQEDAPPETMASVIPQEDLDIMDENERIEEYIVGPEPVDCVHRIEWRNGAPTCVSSREALSGPSAWGAAAIEDNNDTSTGDEKPFECAEFDHLFRDEQDFKDMDQLFELFKEAQIPSTQVPSSTPLDSDPELSQAGPTNLSMLTPGRQSLAREIQEGVYCDDNKLSALQRACPNWKENIAFALNQRDEGDVKEALLNVKRSKEKMEARKQKILEFMEQQELALEVFETALTKSLDRIHDTIEENCPSNPLSSQEEEVDGGYLTAPSPDRKKDAKALNAMVQEDLVLLSQHPTSFVSTYVSPSKCEGVAQEETVDSNRNDNLILSY